MTDNSTPFDMFLYEGHVTSLAIPFWTKPGFAIPLIQSRYGSNSTYVQRVDITRRIVGFELCNTKARIAVLEQPHLARIGDQELFAFVDPNGEPRAGSQRSLAPIVRKWVKQIDPPLVRMNFARFCGEDALAARSAAEAIESKSSELQSNERAIRWFIDAVITVELFKALADVAVPQLTAAGDEIFDNALVSVSLSKQRLSIELPGILFDLNRHSGRSHNARIGKVLEFARSVLGRELELRASKDDPSPNAPQPPLRDQIQAVTEELNSFPRQGQRVALLISTILQNPSLGKALLDKYSDGTAFTQLALGILRNDLHLQSDRQEIEQQIAATLPRIIARAYPRQRGRLLLEFARILNRFRFPAMAIRDLTLRSKSKEVEPLRTEILDSLIPVPPYPNPLATPRIPR